MLSKIIRTIMNSSIYNKKNLQNYPFFSPLQTDKNYPSFHYFLAKYIKAPRAHAQNHSNDCYNNVDDVIYSHNREISNNLKYPPFSHR